MHGSNSSSPVARLQINFLLTAASMALEKKTLLCDTAFGPPQDNQTNNPWPPAQYGADFKERNTMALEKPQFAAQQTATDAAAPLQANAVQNPVQHVSVSGRLETSCSRISRPR